MLSAWEKYDNHPAIGPLIEQYRHSTRAVEFLKRDLRTSGNIDEILDASEVQTQLKRQIDGLVDIEEEIDHDRRRDMAWLVVAGIAAITGLINVVIALRLL